MQASTHGRTPNTLRTLVRAVTGPHPRPRVLLGGPGAGKSQALERMIRDRVVVRRFQTQRYLVPFREITATDRAKIQIAAHLGLSPAPSSSSSSSFREIPVAAVWFRALAQLSRGPTLLAVDDGDVPARNDGAGMAVLWGDLAALPDLTLIVSARTWGHQGRDPARLWAPPILCDDTNVNVNSDIAVDAEESRLAEHVRAGRVAFARGDWRQAHEEWTSVLTLSRSRAAGAQSALWEAQSLEILAHIARNTGNRAEAADAYHFAWRLYQNLQHPLGQANCLRGLALLHGQPAILPPHQPDWDAAIPFWEHARALYQSIPAHPEVEICTQAVQHIQSQRINNTPSLAEDLLPQPPQLPEPVVESIDDVNIIDDVNLVDAVDPVDDVVALPLPSPAVELEDEPVPEFLPIPELERIPDNIDVDIERIEAVDEPPFPFPVDEDEPISECEPPPELGSAPEDAHTLHDTDTEPVEPVATPEPEIPTPLSPEELLCRDGERAISAWQWEDAWRHFQTAIRLCERERESERLPEDERAPQLIARAHLGLAEIACERGDATAAVTWLENDVPILEHHHDERIRLRYLLVHAEVARQRENWREAMETYELIWSNRDRILSDRFDADDPLPRCLIQAARGLAQTDRIRGDWSGAAARLAQAAAVANGAPRLLAPVQADQAAVAVALEQYPTALAHYDAAFAAYQSLGMTRHAAVLRRDQGDCALQNNDPLQARYCYEQALADFSLTDDAVAQGWIYYRLASAHPDNDPQHPRYLQNARNAWTRAGRFDLIKQILKTP